MLKHEKEKPVKPTLQKSQLEMWLNVLQIVKIGMYNGNISIKDLTSKYEIQEKK